MGWTYSGNPAASDRDAVRYMVGDVDSTAPLTTDEAIAWEITQWPNIYLAAANVADSIAALLGRIQGMRADGVSYGDAATQMRERAKTLRARGSTAGNGGTGTAGGGLFVGGISQADKASRAADADRVRPVFTRETGAPASPRLGITTSESVEDED